MALPDDDTAAALQRLADDGSDLSRPLVMDFFVAVPGRCEGKKVATEASRFGFKTSVEQDKETMEWTCYCTRTITPNYHTVVQIEHQLDQIGRKYGGYGDGFGSYGNAKPN